MFAMGQLSMNGRSASLRLSNLVSTSTSDALESLEKKCNVDKPTVLRSQVIKIEQIFYQSQKDNLII